MVESTTYFVAGRKICVDWLTRKAFGYLDLASKGRSNALDAKQLREELKSFPCLQEEVLKWPEAIYRTLIDDIPPNSSMSYDLLMRAVRCAARVMEWTDEKQRIHAMGKCAIYAGLSMESIDLAELNKELVAKHARKGGKAKFESQFGFKREQIQNRYRQWKDQHGVRPRRGAKTRFVNEMLVEFGVGKAATVNKWCKEVDAEFNRKDSSAEQSRNPSS